MVMKLRLLLLPLLLVSGLGLSACGNSKQSLVKQTITSTTAQKTTTTLNYANGNWSMPGLASFILGSPGFSLQIMPGAAILIKVSQIDTNWVEWTYPSSIGAFNMSVWAQFVNGQWYRAPDVDQTTGCPYSMAPAICQGPVIETDPLPGP